LSGPSCSFPPVDVPPSEMSTIGGGGGQVVMTGRGTTATAGSSGDRLCGTPSGGCVGHTLSSQGSMVGGNAGDGGSE
jgi:hypothetical protein